VTLRPAVTHGVMSGDVDFDSAVIWGRADQRSRMIVEWAGTESFADARRVNGPWTGVERDFTAKVELTGLPSGERIFYRVRFEDDRFNAGRAETGSFVTAARDSRDVLFAWSGDTCGQGYGINAEHGGLRTYESMRRAQPDFFIHSGDNIYADGPIEAQMKTPAGSIWRNLTTPEKSKVAETLAEYHGNYRYNLLDANVRRFNSEVAVFSQWDDHEVLNNWYPGKVLVDDKRYKVKDVNLLAAHGKRAFLDYMPIRPTWDGRVFRTIDRGPLCEVFILDERMYRGPNTPNRQPTRSRETVFLGQRQIDWLKRALVRSKALWKVIASDMPIGLAVGDGKNKEGKNVYEAFANGDGPPLGRELELVELFSFMKEHRIRNTFWLTADVHYAASHYYDPAKAKFTEFDPFWEFVSGPLHAASLGAGGLDNTFGGQVRWTARKKGDKASGPFTDEQYFGTVRIDGKSKAATITHCDRAGKKLWDTTLEAVLA
jgi:alkaline phosphatase D